MRKATVVVLAGVLVSGVLASTAAASHSWGKYHWARTSTSFTLAVGDNVTSAWDSYLNEAITDWNPSSVLNLTKVTGRTTGATCAPTSGRIEVCNAAYGTNGWLGVAQIWITKGSHIAQGTAKMNDTYFNQAQYNTPAWRRLVMCQEVAHDFGLDHQDENFNNTNLGSCMDYTSDPDGGAGGASATDPSNEHPNAHDFEQLLKIYGHLDRFSSVGSAALSPAAAAVAVDRTDRISDSTIVRHYADGSRVVTHVLWAIGAPQDHAHGHAHTHDHTH
jgi:hypothetical protein